MSAVHHRLAFKAPKLLSRPTRTALLAVGSMLVCPHHAIAQEIYFQPSFSAVLPDRSRYDGSDVSFQLMLGQELTPRIGWFAGYMGDEFVPRAGAGLIHQRAFDIGATFNWGLNGVFRPYSPASIGIVDSSLAGKRNRAPSASLGLGTTVQLPWEQLRLTSEIRARYSHGSVYNNDDAIVDTLGTVGLRYVFKKDSLLNGRSQTRPIGPATGLASSQLQAQALVAPANQKPPDADQDRVADGLDRCPNTVATVRVDEDGCVMQ